MYYAIPPINRETCIKKLVTSKGIIHDGVGTGWCPKARLPALDWFNEYLKR